MKKNLMFIMLVLFAGLFLAGCVVYVVPEGSTPNRAVVQTTSVYTAPVPGFYTLKVLDNRWVFLQGNEEVSMWEYYPDGTCIRHGREINGLVKIFYGPGQVAAEMEFKNNIRDGYYRTYWTNGKPRESGEFTRGKKEGFWMNYDTKGSLYRNASYHSGEQKKIVFETNKHAEQGRNEWDWKFMGDADKAKKFKSGEFDREKIYPRDGSRKKWYGGDAEKDNGAMRGQEQGYDNGNREKNFSNRDNARNEQQQGYRNDNTNNNGQNTQVQAAGAENNNNNRGNMPNGQNNGKWNNQNNRNNQVQGSEELPVMQGNHPAVNKPGAGPNSAVNPAVSDRKGIQAVSGTAAQAVTKTAITANKSRKSKFKFDKKGIVVVPQNTPVPATVTAEQGKAPVQPGDTKDTHKTAQENGIGGVK
jgi:hypothetical protein